MGLAKSPASEFSKTVPRVLILLAPTQVTMGKRVAKGEDGLFDLAVRFIRLQNRFVSGFILSAMEFAIPLRENRLSLSALITPAQCDAACTYVEWFLDFHR